MVKKSNESGDVNISSGTLSASADMSRVRNRILFIPTIVRPGCARRLSP